jgi:hypothetical protein
MTIWGLIEEDHHHLEALIARLEQEPERDELAKEFAHQLAADLEAEEKAVYDVLFKRPGFRPSVSRMLVHDEEMRRMAEYLPGSPAHSRPRRIQELKATLARHIEDGAYVHPVAHKELPHHLMEHMKHEYEWVKHAAMRWLTNAAMELTPFDSALRALVTELEGKPDAAHGRTTVEHLLTNEQNSAFVCQAALGRSQEASHRSLLGEVAESHLRNADRIGTALSALHDKPRRRKHAGWLSGWLRVLSAAFVSEKALLRAVKAHEQLARQEHERMLGDAPAGAGMRKLLQHLIEHGREHENKLEAAIAAYPQDVCASFEK